jgi:hypothetical protein
MNGILDSVRRIEPRQVAGAILNGLLWWYIAARGISPVDDLDGMFGLLLVTSLGMIVPRRWLPRAFWLIAAYFVTLGTWWLGRDITETSKSSLYWIAFFLTAGICVACAKMSSRKATGEAQPPS